MSSESAIEKKIPSRKVERGMLYFPGKNGAVIGVIPQNGKKFVYEELRHAVGGLIESIAPAIQHQKVWANEEGVLQRLEDNQYTWNVANKAVYLLNGYGSNWRIVGRVLVVFKTDDLSADSGRIFVAQAVQP
jgi:hypothetical protein